MIVVYCGVQVDKDDHSPRFPAADVPEVASRLRTFFANVRPRRAVGAAASGADLLAIEGARREGVAVDIVLPFDVAQFRATSVEDRGTPWTDRFDRLLREAPASFYEGEGLPSGEVDDFLIHNTTLLDHAAALAEPGEELWVLAVRAKGSTGSVTDDLVEKAYDRGLVVIEIAPTIPERRTVFVAMPYGRKFDPVTRRTIDCDDAFRLIYVPALLDCDVVIKRADLETDSGVIHVGMIEDLAHSELVLCDLTATNFNVAYEMGLRHAFAEKATVLVYPILNTSKKQQVAPFDVMPIRQVRFTRGTKITDSEATAGVRALLPTLRTALAAPIDAPADSPVHTWFERSGSGKLTRRGDASEMASREQEVRQEVQAALLSSDPREMSLVAARLSGSELPKVAIDGLSVQLAVGLLAEQEYNEARGLIERLEPVTPSHWVLWAQQKALILRRLGESEPDPAARAVLFHEAEKLLSQLLEAIGDSSETCGIAAGLAKRRAMGLLAENDRIGAAGHLSRMVDLYRRGWQAEPDYYMGVNLVAGLRVLAQHFGGAESLLEEARAAAPVAIFFAQRELDQDPNDFYAASTIAELLLNLALMARADDREDAVMVAASRFAEVAAMRVSPDKLKAARDQLAFLRMVGDPAEILDPLEQFLRPT